jgi:hypothetical protein
MKKRYNNNHHYKHSQLAKELSQFLEQSKAIDTDEIEDLLKQELEYKRVTREILDKPLFKIRSLRKDSLECYSILKNHVFHTSPDRKDYSQILLTVMQKYVKKNPEYKVTALKEEYAYEVIFKVAN